MSFSFATKIVGFIFLLPSNFDQAFLRGNSSPDNSKINPETTTNDLSISGSDFTRFLFESPNKNQKGKYEYKEPNENLINITNHLNNILVNFGFGKLGDMFSFDEEEMHKTVDVVYELVDHIVKDMEFEKEADEKISKMEHDNSVLLESLKNLKAENKRLKNNLVSMNNSLNMVHSEKAKLAGEKESLKQNVLLLNQKVVQYQQELNQKEEATEKFKEQMLKKRLQIVEGLQAEFISPNGPESFTLKLAAGTSDNIGLENYNSHYRQKLLDENQNLREILKEIQTYLVQENYKSQRNMIEVHSKLTEMNLKMFEMPLNILGPYILKTIKNNIDSLSQSNHLSHREKSETRTDDTLKKSSSAFIKIYRSNKPQLKNQPDRNEPPRLEGNRAGIRRHRRTQSSFVNNKIIINTSAEQSFIINTPCQNSPPKLCKNPFSLPPPEVIIDCLDEVKMNYDQNEENQVFSNNRPTHHRRNWSFCRRNVIHPQNVNIPSEE